MDKERNFVDCELFRTRQCPDKKALWGFENLVSEISEGVKIDRQSEVTEARNICGECKSFEPKKRG